MEPTKKQIQNRKNYERNRKQILKRGKAARMKSELISGGAGVLAMIQKILGFNRLKGWIALLDSPQKVFLCLLIGAMTLFSIRETIAFLCDAETDIAGVWLKALIGEGIILAFSWLSFEKKALQALKVLVLVGTCLYTLFSTSGRVVFSGAQNFAFATNVMQSVKVLETEITEKQNIRKQYLEKGWISAARKLDQKLDQLHEKLDSQRNQVLQVKSPIVTQSATISLLFFRLMVMLANILCVHKLSELFQTRSDMGGLIQPRLALVRN